MGHVHLSYNLSYSACFFSQNSIFLSQKKQPTVFFSRLTILAERLHGVPGLPPLIRARALEVRQLAGQE
jgi:hypothetical protein